MFKHHILLGWLFLDKIPTPIYSGGKNPDITSNKDILYYSVIHKEWGMMNTKTRMVKYAKSLQVSKENKAMLLLLKE